MEHPILVDISKKMSCLKEIPVTSDKFLIGRGLHNGLVVEDVDVSRTHCIFERNNDEWTISDKSSNGTFLNGQLLDKSHSHKLTTGDIVGLSDSIQFVFKMPSNTHTRAVGKTTKKPLSEDDILNIAESVIADVEAFQAEYESEKFDETLFNNANTNNHLEASNSNQQNTGSSFNNPNTIGPVSINHPNIVLNIAHQPIASSHTDVIMKQIPESSSLGQPCGSIQVQLPVASNIDSSSTSVAPQQPQSVEQPANNSQKGTSQPQPSNLDYVEDELQCAICAEMFVQAVTLSCSHTFCKFCISQWQKTQNFCPICRNKITVQFPTRVVDNFIEKVLENASEEVKQHRRELLEQRQAASAPTSSATAASSSTAATSTSTAATSTSTSSTSNERRQTVQEPIEVSSEDENSDEDNYSDDDMSDYSGSDWERDYDDDDWFDYNGLPGHYYGGYGHCYSCGQRGHWANGCPNKRR